MQEFKLRPARRGEIYTRAVFFGEAGQGKTLSALEVAFHLADLYSFTPDQIAVGDTELVESADRVDDLTGSAEKYVGRPCNCNRCQRQGLVLDGFQTVLMEPGSRGPDDYCRLLKVFAQSGIKIAILDGITDEWRSLLKIVDAIKAKSRNREDGWGEARPLHAQFEQACMEFPGHLIVTCRAKRESRHKKAEDGMGDVLPDQDGNVLHLYDLAVFFKRGAGYVVKSRDDRLEGAHSNHPGADLAEGLKRWCDDPRAKQAGAQAEHRAIHSPRADPLPETAPNTRTDAGGRSAQSTRAAGASGKDAGPSSPSSSTTAQQPKNGGANGSANQDLCAEVERLCAELKGLGKGEIAQQSLSHMAKVRQHRPSLEKLLGRQAEVIEQARAEVAAAQAPQDPEAGFDAPF